MAMNVIHMDPALYTDYIVVAGDLPTGDIIEFTVCKNHIGQVLKSHDNITWGEDDARYHADEIYVVDSRTFSELT